MGFKILSASDLSDESKGMSGKSNERQSKPPRAFINKNGQLEFVESRLGTANLRTVKAVKFACSDANKGDLYLILCKEPDKDTFNVQEFLGHYYILATSLFQSLGYEFTGFEKIEFEFFQEENLGDSEVFRMQLVEDDTK